MSVILKKSPVGHAEEYFEKELANDRENYYSVEGTQSGQWTGKGAEVFGLSGKVEQEDFIKLSRGVNPNTGKRFRRQVLTRTREENGELKAVNEIAGWDMVISAPKSVSIVALIGKDERVRQVHDQAVSVVIERAEKFAQSNNGGGKKEHTGNIVVARFSHDSSRPAQNGIVAPQLHDHCFIMNATQRRDGVIKPLESLELHRSQYYLKSVYYTELANGLQKLGYEIEIDSDTGAPEIVGISKEYREACSPRHGDIQELAKKAGKNYRQLGLVNRREKVFDQELIQDQHKGLDGVYDYQAERLVTLVQENPSRKISDLEKVKEAKEAVTFALAKVSERDAVFEPRRILLEANKRGIGKTNVAAIETEFENFKNDEKIKVVELSNGREAAFISSDEQIENDLPNHIKAIQTDQSLEDEVSQSKTTSLLDNIKSDWNINEKFLDLSGEQQTAVREIITAKTGVTTLEGRAGVGKTRTLSVLGKYAQIANYEVVGLAPTTGATQELENIDVRSETLQKLLASKDKPREQKRFFIVDESSFVSSRQMDKFFRDAVKQNDRVLLVGDTRQDDGVEAGKPFARKQRDELTTSTKIERIRRQTKGADRETVKELSEEKIRIAIEEMDERGQIFEVADREDRHQAIVKNFSIEPDKTMVITPRNTDRQEINSKIHTELVRSGRIKKEETEITILRPRDELTGVERESAEAYQEGDIISYKRGSKVNKIPAQSLAKVVKADRDQNLLTVELGKGEDTKQITYDPKRLRGVSVFQEEKIKISEGDRLQFRQPFEVGKTKIANGTTCNVKKISPKQIALETDNGKTVKLDKNEAHAVDYGYAVTSYNSQGKTIERVIIHADTTESKQILDQQTVYVAVSGGRDEIAIFTDDVKKLPSKLARKIEKSEISQTVAGKIEKIPQIIETKPVPKVDEIQTKPTVDKTESKMESVEVQEKTQVEEITQTAVSVNNEEQTTAEIETQRPSKEIKEAELQKNHKDLILEVLQLVRDSLDKQDIIPEPQMWKKFAESLINDMPGENADASQGRLFDSFQENISLDERITITGKSKLEATYIILTTISETQRDELIKNAFAKDNENPSTTTVESFTEKESIAKYEIKPIPKIETGNMVRATDLFFESADNERSQMPILENNADKKIIKTPKLRNFAEIDHEKIDRVSAATENLVKAKELFAKSDDEEKPQMPTPKVRNFANTDHESLIKELITAANEESRNWNGEDLSYKQERRLIKMYRLRKNKEPNEKQLDKLESLQDRFDKPIPKPKNLIEASILILDNMTSAEKSVELQGHIAVIDKVLKFEESKRQENAKSVHIQQEDLTPEYDPFGRTDIYFTKEMYNYQRTSPEGKPYRDFIIELQDREFISSDSSAMSQKFVDQQTQEAFYQMGVANALQEQIKKSLDDQGVKLNLPAQQIINNSVDSWSQIAVTDHEIKDRQFIISDFGKTFTPDSVLEVDAYDFNMLDERQQDEFCYDLAKRAQQEEKEKSASEVETRVREESVELKEVSVVGVHSFIHDDDSYDDGM